MSTADVCNFVDGQILDVDVKAALQGLPVLAEHELRVCLVLEAGEQLVKLTLHLLLASGQGC